MNKEMKAIVGSVELVDLHMVETRAVLHLENIQIKDSFEWVLDVDKGEHCGRFDTEQRILVCGVRFNLDARAGGEKPVVEVFCEYCLTYVLPEGIPCSDEDAAEFAALNGTFNAWPFFREYVQSLTSRMGVPLVTLPLRRYSTNPGQP